MPDYELLELILFRAFPRIDTKPIAKRLLARFGSFAEVVSAPAERLKEVEGVGDRAVAELKLIKAAAERLTKGEIRARPGALVMERRARLSSPRARRSKPANSSAFYSSTRRTI